MNINEFEPYKKTDTRIDEYKAKIISLEAEIEQVELDLSMPVLPPSYPEGATAEEIMEIARKLSPEHVGALGSQVKFLKEAIKPLEIQLREASRAFDRLICAEHQESFDEIQKKIATGFAAIQEGIIQKRDLEVEISETGANMAPMKRYFNLNLDTLIPEFGNSHQNHFYKDCLECGLLKLTQISPEIKRIFNLTN